MTAKEKAIELVSKMCLLDCRDENIIIAKQCALICVDEIINTGVNQDYIEQDGYMLSLVEFYTEVKQEINKI